MRTAIRAGVRTGVVLASVLVAAAAIAQEPIARIELRDPEPVLVSAGARLAVDVLVPTFFRGPVRFPEEIELDGAIVLLAPGSSVNLNERIGGTSWAGVRRTYRVYPTRPGIVSIDPLPITIVYALDDGSASESVVVRTPSLQLDAYLPDEARRLAQFFASESFRLDTATVPDVATVRVGETLTRTFTMEARNTPGLFLPSLTFPAIDGASVYPGQPSLAESGGQRGSARVITRTESVTYTFEEEGEFELPGVAVNWWDLDANQLRQGQTPALTVTVIPNPDLDAAMVENDQEAISEAPPERAWVALLRRYWRHLLIGLALLGLGMRLLPHQLGRLHGWLEQQRHERSESEAHYFREFVRVARSGSASQVYAALTRWLDRWHEGNDTPTLTDFAARCGDEELRSQVALLADAAFGDSSPTWSRQALTRGAERARRRQHKEAGGTPALSPLNPA